MIGNAETYGSQHAKWAFSGLSLGYRWAAAAQADVVLVGVTADLVSDVRRLCQDGHSVLVVIHGTDPGLSAALLKAGACVLQGKEQSISTLSNVVSLVLADSGHSGGEPASRGGSAPHLSDREVSVLRAYTSGLTLDAVARKLGIRLSTAKTYLKRIKEKYQQVGRPAYTKLDLASRVREDNLESTAEPAAPAGRPGFDLKVNPGGTYVVEVAARPDQANRR